MKTKEELNAIKEEVEALNKKLAELSEEELAEVAGGDRSYCLPYKLFVNDQNKEMSDGNSWGPSWGEK